MNLYVISSGTKNKLRRSHFEGVYARLTVSQHLTSINVRISHIQVCAAPCRYYIVYKTSMYRVCVCVCVRLIISYLGLSIPSSSHLIHHLRQLPVFVVCNHQVVMKDSSLVLFHGVCVFPAPKPFIEGTIVIHKTDQSNINQIQLVNTCMPLSYHNRGSRSLKLFHKCH